VKPVRVVIADDSAICREALRLLFEADGDIEVVGEAGDGAAAVASIAALAPDLVTMDIQMPGLGGLGAIEQIMATTPVPILVLTGQPAPEQGGLVFEAVRRGALDVWEKPRSLDPEGNAPLRAHLRRLARVSVVRHIAASPARLALSPARALAPRPASAPAASPSLPAREPRARLCPIVGIASSSGGPSALAAILGRLPADFPACLAVVQHVPVGFAEPFARFLRTTTPLEVVVVSRRAEPRPGCILVAPDDRHLIAAADRAFLPHDAPALRGHRPSATLLFRSLAQVFGATALGVVLTGIGDDGAAGLAEMRRAGALTFAQDEASSAIWGMPRAAIEAGGAVETLPLTAIAERLLVAVRARRSAEER
jgi:two-component system chemotaxis response regulator CheB